MVNLYNLQVSLKISPGMRGEDSTRSQQNGSLSYQQLIHPPLGPNSRVNQRARVDLSPSPRTPSSLNSEPDPNSNPPAGSAFDGDPRVNSSQNPKSAFSRSLDEHKVSVSRNLRKKPSLSEFIQTQQLNQIVNIGHYKTGAEPENPDLEPGKPDQKIKKSDLEPEKPELKPGKLEQDVKNPDLEPGKPELEPGNPNREPGKPNQEQFNQTSFDSQVIVADFDKTFGLADKRHEPVDKTPGLTPGLADITPGLLHKPPGLGNKTPGLSDINKPTERRKSSIKDYSKHLLGSRVKPGLVDYNRNLISQSVPSLSVLDRLSSDPSLGIEKNRMESKDVLRQRKQKQPFSGSFTIL